LLKIAKREYLPYGWWLGIGSFEHFGKPLCHHGYEHISTHCENPAKVIVSDENHPRFGEMICSNHLTNETFKMSEVEYQEEKKDV
jgi:hypothetical protein